MIDGVKRAEVLRFSLSFFFLPDPIQLQSEAAKAAESVKRRLHHTHTRGETHTAARTNH